MSVSARLGARISAPPVLGPALAVEARLDVDRDQGPLAQGRERAQRQVVDERAVDEQPPPRTWAGASTGMRMLNPTLSAGGPNRLTTNWPERRSALAQKEPRRSSSMATVPKTRPSIASTRAPRISACLSTV